MGLSVHYALVVVLTSRPPYMQLLAKEGAMLYFAITILAESSHTAHLSVHCVQVEAGAGLSTDLSQSRPADILVQDWDRGKL